jgi:hypothetical protein
MRYALWLAHGFNRRFDNLNGQHGIDMRGKHQRNTSTASACRRDRIDAYGDMRRAGASADVPSRLLACALDCDCGICRVHFLLQVVCAFGTIPGAPCKYRLGRF